MMNVLQYVNYFVFWCYTASLYEKFTVLIFKPQTYAIKDEPMNPFIDEKEMWDFIHKARPTFSDVQEIIQKSLEKQRLSLYETAMLINADDEASVEAIKEGARKLKQQIYGDRIVLFAPLYIGNKCSNDCKYCGFRASNKDAIRKTLNKQEIKNEVIALEENGQKRLILVFGEHQDYSPEFIADTVTETYKIRVGNGEIRRVNINAAPLDIKGFEIVKDSGIGTYQVFQETYNEQYYKQYHLAGKKSDFNYRLTSLDRAFEAGIDDVGIGALFGLYDWRYEVLGLVRHTNHLEACYNVGPHTISFPRLKKASSVDIGDQYTVSDDEFSRLIAILRLAVPYTGMILTARENPSLRKEVLQFGVSQIDGGTKIEMGSYSDSMNSEQNLNNEQFEINDSRSLREIVDELIETDNIPSFCTACYRIGRTGEHFMEFSVPGFIKEYCTPNALLTLAEYLEDYADSDLKEKGWKQINRKIESVGQSVRSQLIEKLNQVKQGKRDLYF